jgi:hypothetical protein
MYFTLTQNADLLKMAENTAVRLQRMVLQAITENELHSHTLQALTVFDKPSDLITEIFTNYSKYPQLNGDLCNTLATSIATRFSIDLQKLKQRILHSWLLDEKNSNSLDHELQTKIIFLYYERHDECKAVLWACGFSV